MEKIGPRALFPHSETAPAWLICRGRLYSRALPLVDLSTREPEPGRGSAISFTFKPRLTLCVNGTPVVRSLAVILS